MSEELKIRNGDELIFTMKEEEEGEEEGRRGSAMMNSSVQ